MKLQKRFLREVNKKKYYKFMINIPPELIEKAKLKEGDELEGKAEKGKVVLKKR
jgi:bifunctional DNA-binding transcriptional regulator/antitoxin component of YhaV-PrlF toxin-antitoxin module